MKALRPRPSAAALHGAAALCLAAMAALPEGLARMFLFMAFAGVTPALLVARRWSASSLPAVAVLMGLPVSMAMAMTSIAIPFRATLWLPCALSALVAAGAFVARPGARVTLRATHADAGALLLALLAALGAGAVMASNGPVRDAAGAPAFLARGWYAFDSLYLFALSQHAADTNAYPMVNLFMPGAPNTYPSLIHCGLGWLSRVAGAPASTAVWALHPLVAACAAALLVHATARAASRRRILPVALGAAAVLAIRPDLVAFPQTHAFALPLLLLVLWMTGPPSSRVPARRVWAGIVVAAMLVFSHTVSSIVAIALLAVHAVLMRQRSTRRLHAAASAVAVVGLILAFAAINAGAAPKEPWTANAAAYRFAARLLPDWLPALAALTVAAWMLPRRRRTALLPAVVAVALGCAYVARGLMTADLYGAWFALFNAPRFWHYAAILVLPVLPSIPQARAAMGVSALILCAALSPWLLPAPRSPMLVSTRSMQAGTAQLVVGAPEVANADMLGVVGELRRLSDPRDVVLSDAGRWVAGLSGRPSFTADPVNLWARGSVSTETYSAALAAHAAAFSAGEPAGPAAHMRANGIRWLVANCSAPGVGPVCASADADASAPLVRLSAGPGWNLFRLP